MLTSLPLKTEHWTQISTVCGWQALRMNLNTFKRHKVLGDKAAVKAIAKRLKDKEEVERSRVFPYQILTAYKYAEGMPHEITEALQDVLEMSVDNVPQFDGKVYVFVDVSGSMSHPMTGVREGATSKIRCVDVAGLMASVVLRRYRDATVLAFDTQVHHPNLNSRDSIATNAMTLAKYGGGGTNCSLPLAELNSQQAKGDLCIYISDYESWVDSIRYGLHGGSATATMAEWKKFKSRNPDAKLVCIDLTPQTTVQAKERADILNVGGFSDKVFDIVTLFAHGKLTPEHWVGEIEKVDISGVEKRAISSAS